jgi:hypothetical protein
MADDDGYVPLSAQDINEVAQLLVQIYDGDLDDFRRRANNMQPFLHMLSNIQDRPEWAERLLGDLPLDAAGAADSQERQARATTGLQILLWYRLRHRPIPQIHTTPSSQPSLNELQNLIGRTGPNVAYQNLVNEWSGIYVPLAW